VILVLQDNVEGVNNAGNVTKDGQQDVNAEVTTASSLEEDTQRREQHGEDDLANVASSESHCDGICSVRLGLVITIGCTGKLCPREIASEVVQWVESGDDESWKQKKVEGGMAGLARCIKYARRMNSDGESPRGRLPDGFLR
jgi:hypothetical protein